jgi:hypothetical protein
MARGAERVHGENEYMQRSTEGGDMVRRSMSGEKHLDLLSGLARLAEDHKPAWPGLGATEAASARFRDHK